MKYLVLLPGCEEGEFSAERYNTMTEVEGRMRQLGREAHLCRVFEVARQLNVIVTVTCHLKENRL